MSAPSSFHGFEVGQMLTFVALIDGIPHSEQVTVSDADPFIVEARATWCRNLRRGKKVVLIRPVENSFAKSECEIVTLSKFRNVFRIEFDSPVWHSTDRRRFPRFEVEIPALVRKVAEREGEIMLEATAANTRDISAGGAWLRGDEEIASGTVVQVELNLHGHVCRALSVVVRSAEDNGGFAVEFLDFVGSSRYILTEFLRLAA
jgi:hypothetical protein